LTPSLEKKKKYKTNEKEKMGGNLAKNSKNMDIEKNQLAVHQGDKLRPC